MNHLLKYVRDLFLTIILGLFVCLWLAGVILAETLVVVLIVSFIIFVIFPFVFRFSISVQRGLLFLTFVRLPHNFDFTKPTAVQLYATRNFYITHKDPEEDVDVRLGVWHILPNNMAKLFPGDFALNETIVEHIRNEEEHFVIEGTERRQIIAVETKIAGLDSDWRKEAIYDEILKNIPSTVILYLHGNSGSRAVSHRVSLYKEFRELGYHVFAFDYRGYADSSSIPPTENGVVRDALEVYKYITNLTRDPVFIWGHSLGTGVGTHLLTEIAKLDVPQPKGIFLEAPFNNIRDEVAEHTLAQIFKLVPWFDYAIPDAMETNGFRFRSDEHINQFHQPVCILHAEDDLIVPFKLGYKLYREALEKRHKDWGPIEFHRFDRSRHFGHRNLYKVPELKDIVKTFVNNFKNEVY